MKRLFIAALLLAATTASAQKEDPSDFFNPTFCSPNGEVCLVIRRFPELGDFERVTTEAYYKRDAVQEWLDEYPIEVAPVEQKREPTRAALYRRWPSGNQELLAEIEFRPGEPYENVLVTNAGYFVTYGELRGGAKRELMTIRAQDGSIVRTFLVRDVVTPNDQQWLSRGSVDDVRFSIVDDYGVAKLRVTMLVTDGKWDDAEARYVTHEIDLATGALPPPDRDYCPVALRVVAEVDEGQVRGRSVLPVGPQKVFDADDVVPIASPTLLSRAIVRITPEYPEVAYKARISGRVRVEIVVGRDGNVEAARVHQLPFGIDKAVADAIMAWTFTPDATRVSGSFNFHFEIVRPARIEVQTIHCH